MVSLIGSLTRNRASNGFEVMQALAARTAGVEQVAATASLLNTGAITGLVIDGDAAAGPLPGGRRGLLDAAAPRREDGPRPGPPWRPAYSLHSGERMHDGAARSSLLAAKHYDQPSVFRPENLMREARRQRGLAAGPVPAVCVLDPDGDMVRTLHRAGRTRPAPDWACYHTDLHVTTAERLPIGIVGLAVGAPFAVLVAEQLFVSGCQLLLSVTSAGQIAPLGPTPYFVLIDRALRDEGTSHHYLPPSAFAEADPGLVARALGALAGLTVPVHRGTSWTTDAPYRETEEAIAAAAAQGAVAVEMETAALYAFARARGRSVLCFAHVTNQMARIEGDFEKGAADGTDAALAVIAAAARGCGFGV